MNKQKTNHHSFPLPGGERTKVRVKNISKAKILRKNQTDAEKLLWFKIRNRQMEGFKFRRQERIGQYIADFVCFEKKLIIEIDGGQHNENKVEKYDRERMEWLKSEDYNVLRFWNNDVIGNPSGVLEKLRDVLLNLPSLQPSPQMGEEEDTI